MGTWYVPEIFVPRRLKNRFYLLRFMTIILSHRWDSSLLPTRKMPVRNLCHISVWYRIRLMRSFAMCRLLLGRFTALESSLHWLSVKRTKAG